MERSCTNQFEANIRKLISVLMSLQVIRIFRKSCVSTLGRACMHFREIPYTKWMAWCGSLSAFACLGLFLGVFRARLDGAWHNLVWWRCPCPWHRFGMRWNLRSLPVQAVVWNLGIFFSLLFNFSSCHIFQSFMRSLAVELAVSGSPDSGEACVGWVLTQLAAAENSDWHQRGWGCYKLNAWNCI